MTSKFHFFFSPLLVAILSYSCAPTRFVKPLKKEQKAVSGTLGGALINQFNIVMPIPLTEITGGYGITDNLTAFGSLHTTALLFGVVQLEAGVLKSFIKPDEKGRYKPGFSATFNNNFAVDVWEGNMKYWPQVDANLFWDYKFQLPKGESGKYKVNNVYLGISNWFELSKYRSHEELQKNHFIFSPHVGHRWERAKWDYTFEAKFLAPYLSNQDMVVDYFKPQGKRGAIGAYITILRKF